MERRINIQLNRTYNLGNYESMRVQVGFETDIPAGSEVAEEYRKCWDITEAQLQSMEESYGFNQEK